MYKIYKFYLLIKYNKFRLSNGIKIRKVNLIINFIENINKVIKCKNYIIID